MNSSINQQNFNLVAPILMIILAIAGMILAWFGFAKWSADQRYNSFVPVDAVISSSETVQSVFSGHRSLSRNYYTNIEFEYHAADGEKRTKKYRVSDTWCHPEWGSAASWDQGFWRAGKSITVYVDPHNSNDWSLDRGTDRETYLVLILGCIMTVSGFALFYPMLFRFFKSDSGETYYTSDDPRMLARDNHFNVERHRD